MINLEKDYRPVSFDDKDICTPEMWESIFNYDWVSYQAMNWSSHKALFFYDGDCYAADMAIDRIVVSQVYGMAMADTTIGKLKDMFMNCNEDNDPQSLHCEAANINENRLVFRYYLKENQL